MTLTSQELLATGLVQDPGAIPLVIGVAGHRDPRPEDLPVLRERCRSLLVELMELLPHTPLLMLNGLAAGMDTEAAEIFLDVTSEQRRSRPEAPNHQLVAALPKPKELYIKEDFKEDGEPINAEERQRLIDLLQKADAILDGDNCQELTAPSIRSGETRDRFDPRCYGKQGMFLVRHCYLLLAFSNGIDSGKIGGTSQTVAMQRGELYPLFMDVDEVIAAREPGVVVEVTTPRESDDMRYCPVGAVRYWGENLDGSRTESNEMTTLEKQSLRSLLKISPIPYKLESINSRLGHWPPAEVHGDMQSSLWRYADHQANLMKKRYVLWCRLVMVGSVAVGLSISHQAWQAVGLLVVLAAVVIFPRLQQGPKLLFIQWRCLAESLLVTDQWAALNINSDTADLFHSHTNQNFAWMRTVLRARRLQLMAIQSKPSMRAPFPEAMDCCRLWIVNQAKWLESTIKKQQVYDQSSLWFGMASFTVTVILSLLYSIIGFNQIDELWSELGIATTAALLGYRELMGYGDTNARYGRSLAQFRRAVKALTAAKADPGEPEMLPYRKRLVVQAVGMEKIDELNDWVGDQLQRVYKPGG